MRHRDPGIRPGLIVATAASFLAVTASMVLSLVIRG